MEKEPFNHWVFDNYISKSAVQKINEHWPLSLRYQDKATSKKHHCNEFPPEIQKYASHFLSNQFTSFLHNTTGHQVVPDLDMKGGGFHEIKRGGFLKAHVDFNVQNLKEGFRYRKLNCLLYLNEDWRDEWGGHLILYDNDLNPVKSIAPIAGRLVIFETSETSWHGHPDPLMCPVDRSRRSLAFYYYSEKVYPKADGKINTIYRG